MTTKRFIFVMAAASTITLLTLGSILALTFQGKIVPPEIYAILGASSGVIFGGQFINKIPPTND